MTRTELRWVQSKLGTTALQREVAALRCGLDAEGAWEAPDTPCPSLFNGVYSNQDRKSGKPLPFDAARAHALYKGLFGEVEDLIKSKHLLIVPSGPLTQLPFQVLVSTLPSGVTAGEVSREVGRDGAELVPLTDEDRKALPADTSDGVRLAKPIAGGPAEAAGLRAGDILLALDERGLVAVPEAISAV